MAGEAIVAEVEKLRRGWARRRVAMAEEAIVAETVLVEAIPAPVAGRVPRVGATEENELHLR